MIDIYLAAIICVALVRPRICVKLGVDSNSELASARLAKEQRDANDRSDRSAAAAAL